jgi:hypothetical protein
VVEVVREVTRRRKAGVGGAGGTGARVLHAGGKGECGAEGRGGWSGGCRR